MLVVDLNIGHVVLEDGGDVDLSKDSVNKCKPEEFGFSNNKADEHGILMTGKRGSGDI